MGEGRGGGVRAISNYNLVEHIGLRYFMSFSLLRSGNQFIDLIKLMRCTI